MAFCDRCGTKKGSVRLPIDGFDRDTGLAYQAGVRCVNPECLDYQTRMRQARRGLPLSERLIRWWDSVRPHGLL